MFTATLLAVLVVFIKEGTNEARKLVYGLVLANIGLTLVALLVSQHVRIPGSSVPAGVTASTLQFSARVAVVGATLLFFDVMGIILFYEYLGRYLRRLWPRVLAALVLTVAFDNAWFTFLVQSTRADYLHLMWAGFVGKASAALFYATALYFYLRYFDPHEAALGTGDVSDVFAQLTYRERYEQARQRLTRDALTGVYNRGYFDELLPSTLANADRYRQPFSLLFVDTDNFKTINDTHSHAIGDQVLRLVADTLKEHARSADTVCRYGGDEFIVILSGANAEAAAAFAERVRNHLRERAKAAASMVPSLEVTATVGIATYLEDPANSADELVRLADNRLYVGKRAGRDRVVWRDLPAISA
jgi:diguanylate cyclase (GGDEF)-like protein